ncbi:ATP-binding protein [Bosea sp. (in: a-proteobacteria)]|uniref:ATP-binding protein n=1 Tax=Bosea sp. (in: a-proteobacteria) TaxID=1871050 RepID=UPI001AD18534|nr:ATP-binding protein [Bosea sp. (in: a-proteobacteria)]MBN9436388.1 DUF4118 domain-containing protein [Bosea sp. (in: a-proteobacteria)]
MRLKQSLLVYANVLLLVAVATALAATVVSFATLDSVSAIYMLPVLIAAVRYGTGPAIMAALLGALLTTLFYPPLFSVKVFRLPQLIDLVTSLVVALVIGQLAGRIRQEMLRARNREREIRQLYQLGGAMAAAGDADAIYGIVADHMTQVLARPVTVFRMSPRGHIETVRAPTSSAVPEALTAAAGNFGRGVAKGAAAPVARVDLGTQGHWLLCRLGAQDRTDAVLAATLGDLGENPAEELVAQASSILAEGSRSLERLGLSKAVEERNLRQRTDELRDILMESVSHDLRTPVASIMGAASVLAEAPGIAGRPELAELPAAIGSEARRLDQRIQNLLDVTRIRSGALQPRLDTVDAADLINAALEGAAANLRGRRIERHFTDDLPFLRIDPILIEQALINLLDNAAKFGPAAAAIAISASVEAEKLVLAVQDQGPGLDAAESEQIFERFHRGERHADIAGGSGLGLAIAKVFVEANGGTIEALSEGLNRGTTMRIALPLAADQPTRDDDE